MMICILFVVPQYNKTFFHLGKKSAGDASIDHVVKEKDAKIQVFISLFAGIIIKHHL